MSAVGDIIDNDRRNLREAVAMERESQQYKMLLAGETCGEIAKSILSLCDSLEKCGGEPFFVRMIRLQAEFLHKRAERLRQGE